MLIYGYQSQGFTGNLIPIVLAQNTAELTILGPSLAKQREIRILLKTILPSLPKVTIQLPNSVTTQEILAPLSLALLAYERHLLTLDCPAILCYGEIGLGGVLKPSPSLRDIPLRCTDQAIGLVLVGRQTLLPSRSGNFELCECETIQDAGSQLCKYCLQHQGEKASSEENTTGAESLSDPFSNIIGLKRAKQALLYAVAGNLPILFYGPPGSGKSLLLSRIASLLPALTSESQQELSAMQAQRIDKPPVFEIHPGTKEADLMKGVVPAICKAHGGSLIVDELSHQKPNILTLLASVMDSRTFSGYPVNTLVACATNACSCANLGSVQGVCHCSEMQIDKFWARLGYPLLDRFAIALCLNSENLLVSEVNAPTFDYERIREVRKLQKQRSEQEIRRLLPLYTKISCNTQLSFRRSLLCCKLARTIADYEGKILVTQAIMQEAEQLYLLPKDRHYH